MSLFLFMLPFYLLGNFHCIGMCGPLVMMLGQHRYRNYYFLGRVSSFTMAGALAGGIGSVIGVFFHQYQLQAIASLLLGGGMFFIGLLELLKKNPIFIPISVSWIGRQFVEVNKNLSLLLLRDEPFPVYLFGFFAILLPCGQSLFVFSACAIAGDFWIGLINGFAFALLTSPSLFFALHSSQWILKFKFFNYRKMKIFFMLGAGVFAIFRGLAELQIIPHLSVENYCIPDVHFVLF